MVFLVVFLSVAFLWSIVYILRLKRDVRSIKGSLQKIKTTDTNMRLTTLTFDKDVRGLTQEMNEILDRQKEVQMESERVNREFRQGITNISHDLRTPLTSANGYIGLIRSDKISDEQKLEYLEVVEGRLTSLANLMNELFEYTQIIEGKIKLELELVDVCVLVREEIASFYDTLVEGCFDVKVAIPEVAVHLIVDRAKLQRVIQNLIANVVKHGVKCFDVTVVDGRNAGYILIRMMNEVAQGKDLEVERMFERFYTSDVSRNSQKTGLGLAITKALVEQMGGKIIAWLEDDLLVVDVIFDIAVKK